MNYKGAIILVSLDKMFLDRITKDHKIVQHRIFDFKVLFEYMILRKELREQKTAQKNQDKQQQTEKLIEKFRAKASKQVWPNL